MLTLPSEYLTLIQAFAPIFSKRIWSHIQVLVLGAILAPGKRTVSAVLRIMGLSQEKHFQNYHRVLNRAVWSGLEISRILPDGLSVCSQHTDQGRDQLNIRGFTKME